MSDETRSAEAAKAAIHALAESATFSDANYARVYYACRSQEELTKIIAAVGGKWTAKMPTDSSNLYTTVNFSHAYIILMIDLRFLNHRMEERVQVVQTPVCLFDLPGFVVEGDKLIREDIGGEDVSRKDVSRKEVADHVAPVDQGE